MTRLQKIQVELEEVLYAKQAELEELPYDKNSEEFFEISEALNEEIAIIEEFLDKLEDIK